MNVRLGDIDVGYVRHGHGDRVVLVHGLAEDRSSWAPVQSELKAFESFAYDLRGHGETWLGEANGTLEQLGGDLSRFLAEVTGPAACVGYSLGGVIVLWVARSRPDLVRHAVVAGTSSVVGKTALGFFESRIRALCEDRSAFEVDFHSDNAAQLVRQNDLLDAVVERRLAAVGVGGGYINAARAMMKLAKAPLTPILGEIRCPVDIIQADQDAFCPRKAADILRQALPQAGYHEIRTAGHLMSVDQPIAYAETIQRALSARRDPG